MQLMAWLHWIGIGQLQLPSHELCISSFSLQMGLLSKSMSFARTRTIACQQQLGYSCAPH